MEQFEKLLTLNEVAEILNLSPHTVRSLVRQGKLQPTRITRRLLFKPDEVFRLIRDSSAAVLPELTTLPLKIA